MMKYQYYTMGCMDSICILSMDPPSLSAAKTFNNILSSCISFAYIYLLELNPSKQA